MKVKIPILAAKNAARMGHPDIAVFSGERRYFIGALGIRWAGGTHTWHYFLFGRSLRPSREKKRKLRNF
jgi:hypothetical protein